MSTTGSPGALLRAVIDAPRRLDELSTARVIEQAAELVHKQQKGGTSIGAITPDAIFVGAAIELRTGSIPSVSSNVYGAPETAGGKAGDRRSDVYSLGAVMWEALAHEKLTLGKFTPPSELNANVPGELDAICKKALSSNPAERYPSAKVMAAEIATVLDDAGYPDDLSQITTYLDDAFPPVAAGAALAAKLAAASTPAPSAKSQLNQTMMGIKPEALGITPELRKAAASAAPANKTAPLPGVAPVAPAAPVVAEPIAPSAADAKLVAEPVKPAPVVNLHATLPFGSNAVSASDLASAVAALAQQQPAPQKSTATSPDPDAQVPTTLFNKIESVDQTIRDVVKVDAPVVAKVDAPKKPSISTAETVATPALVPTAKPDDKRTEPVAAKEPAAKPQALVLDEKQLDAPAPAATIAGLPAMPPGAGDAPIPKLNDDDFATGTGKKYPDGPPEMPAPVPAAAAPATLTAATAAPATLAATAAPATAAASTATPAAAMVDPAAAVSLPLMRTRRDSGGDLVFERWAASTGEHTALEDPHEDAIVEEQKKQRKRLIVGVGGSLAAILVIAIIALAFGGKKTPPKKEDATAEVGPSRTAPEPSTKATDSPTAPVAQPAGVGSGSDLGSAGSATGTGSDTGSAAAMGSDIGSAGSGSAVSDQGSANTADQAAAQKAADDAAAQKKAADEAAATQAEADRVAKEKADADAAKMSEDERIAKEKADAAQAKKDAAAAAKAQVEVDKKAKADAAKQAAADKKALAEADKAAKVEAAKAKAEADKQAKADAAAKAEAAKQAKADAAKNQPATEPKKTEPKKVAKTEPKRAEPKKVARAEPIDPYAEPKKTTPTGDPASTYKLGFQQYVRGDTAGALQTFRDSLSANPGYPPTYRGLGLVYEKMGQKGQAKRAFSKYLQLSPDAPDADQIRERMQRL